MAIAAVVGIFYLQETTYSRATNTARAANIASCTREVTRDAYEAAAFLTLAERVSLRDNPGDQASALRYRAAALSIADTFPKPGTAAGSEQMIQVQFVSGPGDVVRFHLTEEAEALIHDGCRKAF